MMEVFFFLTRKVRVTRKRKKHKILTMTLVFKTIKASSVRLPRHTD